MLEYWKGFQDSISLGVGGSTGASYRHRVVLVARGLTATTKVDLPYAYHSRITIDPRCSRATDVGVMSDYALEVPLPRRCIRDLET